jgi:hypothetical protein
MPHAELLRERLLEARHVLAHGVASGVDHSLDRGDLLGTPGAAGEIVEHINDRNG